jgi:hypothetical protein
MPAGDQVAGKSLSLAAPPWVATTASWDGRRRRRGPQVRQERGRAVESIARSAPLGAAAPLPPRGASQPRFLRLTGPTKGNGAAQMHSSIEARGTPPLRVGNDVGVDVGNDVGVEGLGHGGTGPGRQGCGACQRSSTRRRRVLSPATDRGRHRVVPGRPSRTNGCAVGTCAVAGCRTFALDRRASRPASTTGLPASLVASKPGGGDSPRTPLHRGRHGAARYAWLVTGSACGVANRR